MTPVAAPSSAIDGRDLGRRASTSSSTTLRDLIRIPSVNPPSPGRARRRARGRPPHRGARSTAAGLEPEIVEPVPGRGSVHARLRGDGTGGEPLLLLSHLDVVPGAARPLEPRPVRGRHRRRLRLRPRRGRHEGDGRDGARRRPAARGRGARGRPRPGARPDPRPPPRRPVHLHRRRGGRRPRRGEMDRRAAARSGCGRPAPSTSAAASRRPSPAAGSTRSRSPRRASPPTASRVRGTWGHGSMPRERQRRGPGGGRHRAAGRPRPDPRHAGHGPLPRARRGRAAARARRASCARSPGDDPARAEAALAAACDPMYARALRALLRDTISPDVIHAGIKYNVIPGDAMVEVDCRVLPGHDRAGDARRCSSSGSGPSSPPPARSS